MAIGDRNEEIEILKSVYLFECKNNPVSMLHLLQYAEVE